MEAKQTTAGTHVEDVDPWMIPPQEIAHYLRLGISGLDWNLTGNTLVKDSNVFRKLLNEIDPAIPSAMGLWVPRVRYRHAFKPYEGNARMAVVLAERYTLNPPGVNVAEDDGKYWPTLEELTDTARRFQIPARPEYYRLFRPPPTTGFQLPARPLTKTLGPHTINAQRSHQVLVAVVEKVTDQHVRVYPQTKAVIESDFTRAVEVLDALLSAYGKKTLVSRGLSRYTDIGNLEGHAEMFVAQCSKPGFCP